MKFVTSKLQRILLQGKILITTTFTDKSQYNTDK